jgi:hypothetical protein
MTTEQIKVLAGKSWEGCHGCDENDRNFWINGFMIGYLNARLDRIDQDLQVAQDKQATLIINNKL